jgi:hypothetical protein
MTPDGQAQDLWATLMRLERADRQGWTDPEERQAVLQAMRAQLAAAERGRLGARMAFEHPRTGLGPRAFRRQRRDRLRPAHRLGPGHGRHEEERHEPAETWARMRPAAPRLAGPTVGWGRVAGWCDGMAHEQSLPTTSAFLVHRM